MEKTEKKSGDVSQTPSKIEGAKEVKVGDRHIAWATEEEGGFLGNVFWYSISALKISKPDLEAICKKVGFKFEDIFKKQKKVDAYKRITHDFKQTERLEDSVKEYMIWDKDPETKKRAGSKRWLVMAHQKEGQDPVFKVLGWWNIKDDKVVSQAKDNDPKFEALTRVLKDSIDQEVNTYTEIHVREALKRTFDHINSFRLRPSGGVYFAPAKHTDILQQYADLFKEINKAHSEGTTELYLIPVVDTDKQRDLLTWKFEQYAVEEAQKLYEEMQSLVDRKQPIQKRTYDRLIAKANEISDIRSEYTTLLKDEFKEAKFRVGVLNEAIMELTKLTREG